MNRQAKELLPYRHAWLLTLVVTALLSAGLMVAAGSAVFAQSGYDYTVQEGESWDTVAQRTGVLVEDLKDANPEAAARENGWLLVGETLVIPSDPVAPSRTHRVEAGQSWSSIADIYDIPVSLLRAANPASIRSSNILYRGEILTIPPAGSTVAAPTATSSVTETSEATGEATEEAGDETTPTPEAGMDAGETMTATVEATEEAAAESTAEATAEATEEATVEATVEATEEMTGTESVSGTEAMTETDAMTSTEAVTGTETVSGTGSVTSTEGITDTGSITDSDEAVTGASVDESAFDLPACPERFADYSQVMTDLSNSPETNEPGTNEPGTDELGADGTAATGLDAVVAFLASCEALVDDGVVMTDLNGDGVDDLVVVYQNPSAEQIFVEGDLVIFNSDDSGYVLGYRARAAGEVRLLTVEDINLDELPDVVWVDTTCGASTCFDTVNVRSWDGTSWADWTDGTITMAYAEINLTDASEEGLGSEITLEGGIYGSVGAGPQRSRSEVWTSVEGAPYKLAEKSYSATECLYHTVLDANRAFLDAPEDGFEPAVALYTQAVEDEGLIKCWVRNDELAELRSFSLFRLAVIAGYSDDAANAAAQIALLAEQYPGSVYDEVGQVWLESYEASSDAAMACEDVTTFAEENSAAWEMLADYGYTNPSFEAIDVCPILTIETAEEDAEATE